MKVIASNKGIKGMNEAPIMFLGDLLFRVKKILKVNIGFFQGLQIRIELIIFEYTLSTLRGRSFLSGSDTGIDNAFLFWFHLI